MRAEMPLDHPSSACVETSETQSVVDRTRSSTVLRKLVMVCENLGVPRYLFDRLARPHLRGDRLQPPPSAYQI